MATLKDIGSALGLSVTTVSRALNGFPEVNEKTRALVAETARRLSYSPNRIAQKLVTGRSGMVGMIVKLPDPSQGDPTFLDIVMGLSACLAARDLDLVFHAELGDDPVQPYRRMLAKNLLDGFILNAPQPGDPRVAFLQAAKVPFVLHGRDSMAADYPYFDIDNHAVGLASVGLLADLGHVRIALVNGLACHSYAQERHRGFLDAMAERGLPVVGGQIMHDRPGESYGYRAALSLLSGGQGVRPTAIVCASTLIAIGVLAAARDKGLRVPQDLSVIAHDDAVPQLREITVQPALTVTHAPLRAACHPLADILIQRLAGVPVSALQISARAELIVRQSTGPVPG